MTPQEGSGPSAVACAGGAGAQQCPASSRKPAGPKTWPGTLRGTFLQPEVGGGEAAGSVVV